MTFKAETHGISFSLDPDCDGFGNTSMFIIQIGFIM
jgi:hypothetical protein